MKGSMSLSISIVLLLFMWTGCQLSDSHSPTGEEPQWGSEGDINYNVYYGDKSGAFLPDHFILPSGMENVFVGYQTAYSLETGSLNTFYGFMSGLNLQSGSNNVFFGAESAYLLEEGSRNVIFGTESAYGITGINGSVFLGFHAGYWATRDNTLYIANSDTDHPLIYGEFDTPLVRINASLQLLLNSIFEGNVSINRHVGMKNGSTIRGNVQCNGATFLGPVNLSSSADINRSTSLALLTMEWNNTNPSSASSDVAFKLENLVQDIIWNIQTVQRQKGLAIFRPKDDSEIVEMTLTPADGPDGLQILMGDGGKYSNGQWLDASSRAYKENIRALGETEALAAFDRLQPVHYNYKTNKNEPVIGFIAEDVPDLVAPRDHKSLSPLEMTALLTRVLQTERKALQKRDPEIAELQSRQESMEKELDEMKTLLQASRLRAGNDRR